MTSARERQEADIVRWLRLFLEPGQVTELRALGVRKRKSLSWFFHSDDLPKMAHLAATLEREGAKGIYFTPNPLRHELLRSANYSAHDSDVLMRRWFLIDVDCIRVGVDVKEPSSNAEKQRAWEVACHVRDVLEDEGLENPIVGDSGNGWHLNYSIHMRNDEQNKLWCRNILRWLAVKCDAVKGKSSRAVLDTSTHNASRIWKLYGTRAQKGTATADRPHRWSRIIEAVNQERLQL